MHKAAKEVHYEFKPGTEHIVVADSTLPPRVGIYSGSFDPVHAGHVSFALQAQKVAGLEHIFFMPERRPKTNLEAEHYTHRAAMIDRALRPYEQFSLLDLPDARLTLQSLPRLRQALPKNAQLNLLVGAEEVLSHSAHALPKLYEKVTLVIAVTSNDQLADVLEHINTSPSHFRNLLFIDVGHKRISSAVVRKSLRSGQYVRGILPSVWKYARHQWLYISLSNHNS